MAGLLSYYESVDFRDSGLRLSGRKKGRADEAPTRKHAIAPLLAGWWGVGGQHFDVGQCGTCAQARHLPRGLHIREFGCLAVPFPGRLGDSLRRTPALPAHEAVLRRESPSLPGKGTAKHPDSRM